MTREPTMEELEQELKQLIVKELALEDVTPEDIVSTEPLFREGLGLDSIDALELAMVISKQYGVNIEADDEDNRKIFHSVRTLAEHIFAHRSA